MGDLIEILGKKGCDNCSLLEMILDMEGMPYEGFYADSRGVPRVIEMKSQMYETGNQDLPALFINKELVAVGEQALEIAGKLK